MRKLLALPAVALAISGVAVQAQSPASSDRDAAHEDRIQDQKQAVKAHEARLAQQDRIQDHREQERARDLSAFHAKEKERLAYEARHNMGHDDKGHERDSDHGKK